MSPSEYAIFGALIFVSLLASCCVLWIVVMATLPTRPGDVWHLCGYHLASYDGFNRTVQVNSSQCEVCRTVKGLGRKTRKLKLVK